ncbi:MAG: aminotransferase class V-fold PLP-dependent enzyme [Bacteroidota bacterium]
MERRKFLSVFGGAYAVLKSDALAFTRDALSTVDGRSPEDVAKDEDFWWQVRHAFTIDRNSINLNNGSVSPAPRVVSEAMNHHFEIQNMSPSLYVDEMLGPQLELVRRRLAAAFGCDSEELAITRNTTEALENVQFGISLKHGDEVLTTTQDYPSMITAWKQRERRDGILLKMVSFPVPPPSMDYLVQSLEKAITPRTKIIHICHVTYTTGQIFPVKRICQMARQKGIETIVDGGHSFAQFPFKLDDLDCDYYGTSLHKWLTAPVGTGFLYVRKEKIPAIWSLFASPHESADNIRKFESIGTFPLPIRTPISEALAFHESIGLERKAARFRYLRERWSRRVEKLPGVKILTPYDREQACAIGSMSIDGIEAGKLTDHLLKKYLIHVRPRFVANEFSCIRVTPNVYTTLEEIDTFAKSIETIVHKGIG